MATQQQLTHVLLPTREYLPILTREDVEARTAEAVERRQQTANDLGLVGIIDAPVAGWRTIESDRFQHQNVEGYATTIIEREFWLRHEVGNQVIGAEFSRSIWMAFAQGFSPTASTSEVSLDAAVRNLRRRIQRSAR